MNNTSYSKPKVSIIIPTHNRGDYIGDALQSIIAQTLPDWEAIVVDDGSTDDTEVIVKSYTNSRIRYIYQENKGVAAARNAGLKTTWGSYIAFLDSDDLFLPNKLELQVNFLEAQPDLGLVAGGFIGIDREKRVVNEVHPWLSSATFELSDWIDGCPFIVNAVLIRREWLERVDFFDENMRYVEDWDLWLRLSLAGCRMGWIKKVVCYYRLHNDNLVRNAYKMKEGMAIMLDKLYAQPNLPIKISNMRNRAYSNIYFNAAARAYSNYDIKNGKEWLTKAVELEPDLLLGKPPKYLSNLASFALSHLCNDAETFMNLVVSSVPEQFIKAHWSKRKIRGLLNAVMAFHHYQHHEYMQVVNKAMSALVSDPSWFRNRGLLSIAARSSIRSLQNPYI